MTKRNAAGALTTLKGGPLLQASLSRKEAARNNWKMLGNNAISSSESHNARVGRKKGSKALGSKKASIRTTNLLNVFRTAGADAALSSNPLRGKPFKGATCNDASTLSNELLGR